jgi:hypothetical protein
MHLENKGIQIETPNYMFAEYKLNIMQQKRT